MGKKSQAKKEKLSIYTPERVLNALLDANLICPKPEDLASSRLGKGQSLGEWTLLISPWGKYWTASVLKAGLPISVVLFSAQDGSYIPDADLYARIKETTFHLNELEMHSQCEVMATDDLGSEESAVVEVEFGEKWFDYRPARPEHFVGRKSSQRNILKYFTNVKKRRTYTRVFAIKGDSGIGKSSLVVPEKSVIIREN